MILAYHRIAETTWDPFGLCVSPAMFRKQMELIREKRLPVSLRQLAEFIRHEDVPPVAVAVTFDDGYLDNLTVASPILMELGIPATFFVTTGRLAEPHEFWWDTLTALTADGALLGPPLDFPIGTDSCASFSSLGDRESALRHLHGIIRPLPLMDREAILEDLIARRSPVQPREITRPLLTAELLELAARPGHEIGAHTVNHLSLTAQPPTVQREEMLSCKHWLEALLNRSVTAFSYPFGDLDSQTTGISHGCGFDLAVTAAADRVGAGCDLLRLPRVLVDAATFGGDLVRA